MTPETPNHEQAPTPEASPQVSERDAILAGMEELNDDVEVVEEPVAEAEEPEQDEDTPDTEEDAEASGDVVEEEDPEPEVQIDSKKLASLQREQKKYQEAADQRSQELEVRESQLKAREESVSTLDDLRSRAAIDPVGVLEALGLKPENFEDTARDFYNRRPDAKVDRHTAQRDMKLREANSEAAQARAEVKALRAEITQEREQRVVAERFDQYIDGAKKSVGEDAPIVSNLLNANPAKFREEVAAVAAKLWKETGEQPDQVDVIAELENNKRTEFVELGFEPPTRATKKPTQSPKKPVGKTITNNLGNNTQTRDENLSEDDLRSDVIRGMATLD